MPMQGAGFARAIDENLSRAMTRSRARWLSQRSAGPSLTADDDPRPAPVFKSAMPTLVVEAVLLDRRGEHRGDP